MTGLCITHRVTYHSSSQRLNSKKVRISITVSNNIPYGMAITATTSVLTGNDWQYAKDIRPGDWVFNRLGKPVKVKTAQTYRSEDCCRVTFSDYLIVEGDNHLAFPAEIPTSRIQMSNYKGRNKRTSKPRIIGVLEMLDAGLYHLNNKMRFSVATTAPIELPHQPLDIPPFLFGFWFMSRKANRTLTVPDDFQEKVFEIFKNAGYKIEIVGRYYNDYTRFRTSPSIWTQLAGKIPTKLPISYLNGSAEQRLELIQGILCTKPLKKASTLGFFKFKSSKKHISLACQYLFETLGAVVSPTYDKYAKTYDLKVQRRQPLLPEMAPKKPFTHYARRYVKSIEPIPAQLCVHIETDDEDGSFLTGEGFIPCR